MNQISQDELFNDIVTDIYFDKKFNLLKKIEHHGTTRFNHSVKVAYLAYKVARVLHLDYVSTARGGILHDYFESPVDRTKKERFTSIFTHSKKAAINALDDFCVNEKEFDIIRTHMFPINYHMPKYAESWLVSFLDKLVGTGELLSKYKYKLSYALNLLIIMLINSVN